MLKADDLISDEVVEGLERPTFTYNRLDNNRFQAFATWLKESICSGLPKNMQKEAVEIIEMNKEVDSMISNVTLVIRESIKKSRSEGRLEGKIEVLIKLLALKFDQVSEDIISKINASNEFQIEAIIENILQIGSLEEINKYFE